MSWPEVPIRILHLEGDPSDRQRVEAALRHAGLSFNIVSVAGRRDFEAALTPGAFDVVLADDRMAGFESESAERIAMVQAPQIPFIVVSGSPGEEAPVERIKDAVAEARSRSGQRQAEVADLTTLEQRVRERTAQLEAANRALAEREQALRLSEYRLTQILDHSPAAICMKDLSGRYLLVNKHFERTTGLMREGVLGRTDHDVFPPRLADVYRANDALVLREVSAQTVEEPALHEDGVRLYSAAKFPLVGTDGHPYAVCAISTDITGRKHAEDEIKTARLEAERANRAKSEFLSRMSHDLRTPMNAVLGFAQLLAAEPLPEAQTECVRQILRGGEHLLELINEVLDIARIESGQLSLSPEPVEVREIVDHAVRLVAPLAQQRQISLNVEPSPLDQASVVADRSRLSQILLNLLSNAVKYNRENGTVTVSFAPGNEASLRINVSDTGAGIPPQKLRLLFRPFERLGAESTGIEGTGLGLTLSRGLAEAMGGSVGVVSRLDAGSTFWVELLLAAEGEGKRASEPSYSGLEYREGADASVLYIEDNVANVRLMERVLSRRPALKLLTSSDGRSGLAHALSARPDVVLLDLHLPDLSGDEVMRQIHADPALRHTPVIVLSADATPGQVRRLLASGAAAYLTKPFNIHEVLSVLDRLLAHRIPSAPRAAESEHRE